MEIGAGGVPNPGRLNLEDPLNFRTTKAGLEKEDSSLSGSSSRSSIDVSGAESVEDLARNLQNRTPGLAERAPQAQSLLSLDAGASRNVDRIIEGLERSGTSPLLAEEGRSAASQVPEAQALARELGDLLGSLENVSFSGSLDLDDASSSGAVALPTDGSAPVNADGAVDAGLAVSPRQTAGQFDRNAVPSLDPSGASEDTSARVTNDPTASAGDFPAERTPPPATLQLI